MDEHTNQLLSRLDYCEKMIKSLDYTLTTQIKESAARPGLFRQELERLESRMMWRMRAAVVVAGVAAAIILSLVSL